METWWKASLFSFGGEINPVDVEKETDKFITVVYKDGWNGKLCKIRSAKLSASECFFKTWGEAHEHMMEKADRSVRYAQSKLDSAKALKQKINNMSRPKDAS